jgi:short-chain Z-isoprenyl diphosphate synthase
MGAEKLDSLIEWCDELAIPVVTVWALSLDNLHRDPEELDELLEVMKYKLRDFAHSATQSKSARSIHVVGRLDILPSHVQASIIAAETDTAHLGPFRLNIAVGYDGREEITEAVRNFLLRRANQGISLEDVANELTSKDIGQCLYSKGEPEPDLIIRTSGELRLSGFLLWQSVHSELYFCDTLWPAFRKIDFLRALRSYQQRQRRFGQ